MSGEEAPVQQQQEPTEEKTENPPTEEPPSEAAQEGEPSPAEEPVDEPAAATPDKAPVAPEEEVFTYRALFLTGYGGYDKVKLQMKKGKPSLKSAEVLVRVKACGLNFAELLGRQGLYELLPSPPVTPGMECSGVIEALGEEVTDRKVGDRVLVLSRHGLWQEVVGGVGIAATQLCQTLEDVTVFGTASASKHETIGQGGVTHPIDYRLDVVLDPLGGSDTHKAFSLLKPMGTLIVFGAANCVTGQKKNLLAVAKTWYNQFTINTLRLMHANKAVCGFHLGYLSEEEELITQTMTTLLELYTQGKIKPRIDSTYHFEQVGDAMRRMHERNNIGKVILLPEPKKEDKKEEEKAESNPEPAETEDKKEEEKAENKMETSTEEVKGEEN
ncbi:unnamed protein product [Coregonus sp. 'balchen']|nr:unnamed protein product [Coregonus sp. 'balchen']